MPHYKRVCPLCQPFFFSFVFVIHLDFADYNSILKVERDLMCLILANINMHKKMV